MDETDARRVLLLRAVENAPAGPLWTDEDRGWASRAARDAPTARYVAERARLAFERLGPRDARGAAWVRRRSRSALALAAAALVGFVPGFLAPGLGAEQRIDLLSPPLHALLAWNLVVYVLLAIFALRPSRPAGWLRGWLARRFEGVTRRGGPLADAQRAWIDITAPLRGARAAALLHLAAAMFAAGMIAGLYWRGLYLDHRAGWQSTFLDGAQVHAWLAALLAPAAAISGLAVPDAAAVDALRVVRGAQPAGSPLPWLHLYAATLALFVVVPRLVLAGFAQAQAAWRSRHLVLPMNEPYFERLRRSHRAGPAVVQVVPHVVAPAPQAAVAIATALARAYGAETKVQYAEPVVFGDEERAAARVPAGTTLALVLCDFAATPEREQQGRLLDALAGGPPRLLLVDEGPFLRRFPNLPDRRDERRRAWRALGQAHGVAPTFADLAQVDAVALARAFEDSAAR